MYLLRCDSFNGIKAWHRQGTTDAATLHGALVLRNYRKRSVKFDVERCERWLDLGANIGAFALYCRQRGAVAECYEPDAENFAILAKNVGEFKLHQAAVSHCTMPQLAFYTVPDKNNFQRGSLFHVGKFKTMVTNVYAGKLAQERFDGVKWDIEGAEFGLIDHKLLPNTRKLVLEYHTSRDASMAALARRLAILQSRFQHVAYPSEYDGMLQQGGRQRSWYDRLIFCWNDE
jgi:FkbM family methyltransferase